MMPRFPLTGEGLPGVSRLPWSFPPAAPRRTRDRSLISPERPNSQAAPRMGTPVTSKSDRVTSSGRHFVGEAPQSGAFSLSDVAASRWISLPSRFITKRSLTPFVDGKWAKTIWLPSGDHDA